MVDGRRASDEILIGMAKQLGELEHGMRSGEQDRRDLWSRVNENQEKMSNKLDVLGNQLDSIARTLTVIPEVAATAKTNKERIDKLEEGPKRRGWMIAGGSAVFGVLGYEHVPGWFKAIADFMGSGGAHH